MANIERAKFIVRIIEIVFALISFAAAGWLINNGGKDSRVQFMTFVGVTAFLLAIFYVICAFVHSLGRVMFGIVEAIINFIWWVFWLAAAASFANLGVTDCSGLGSLKQFCQTFQVSQAFAWLSWILWSISFVFSVIEVRSGVGLTGSGTSSSSAPAYPSSYPSSA